MKRQCPDCKTGKVDTEEIPRGSECSYCHKIIAVNSYYHLVAVCVLLLLEFLSISYDIGFLVVFFFGLLALYTIGYERINARYLPLKVSDS